MKPALELTRAVLLLAALLPSGCNDYPRDSEGTSANIAARHTIRVGIVAGTSAGRARQAAFLAALARRTGATAVETTGSAEPLLTALESGDLDLVLGEFASDTPWTSDVAVIEPLATRQAGDRELQLSPVARNGEHRWVMTVEETVRDLGDAP